MHYDKVIKFVLFGSLFLLPTPAWAANHLWTISEVYTNASGTNQFIELHNDNQFEGFLSGVTITSNANEFTFGSHLPDQINTADTFVLIGTTGFAALTNAPTPDYTLPDNFFNVSGDTVTFTASSDSIAFASIPTNGIDSLFAGGGTGTNSPTNFAGITGTVPEPQSFALAFPAFFGLFLFVWRRTTRRAFSVTTTPEF